MQKLFDDFFDPSMMMGGLTFCFYLVIILDVTIQKFDQSKT
jgi:hypothetical protein